MCTDLYDAIFFMFSRILDGPNRNGKTWPVMTIRRECKSCCRGDAGRPNIATRSRPKKSSTTTCLYHLNTIYCYTTTHEMANFIFEFTYYPFALLFSSGYHILFRWPLLSLDTYCFENLKSIL